MGSAVTIANESTRIKSVVKWLIPSAECARAKLSNDIFFLLCGILIFQNQIWEEEDYSRNKKWLEWKDSAIKANKGDLSGIYPTSKK